MVAQFVSDLYLPLSRDRLEAYRPTGASDLEMITNYFWNIDLAEALVPSLHAVEIAVRNSMNAALTAQYGTDMWFYTPGLLESGQVSQLGGAIRALTPKQPFLAGRLVAELNFGFWVTLLSGPYEQRMWQPGGYALLKAVFPHATGVSRKQVHTRLNDIRELRNRVFHHEPLWCRPNLLQQHADIHQAIEWMSPTLHKAIHAVDTFSTIYAGKADVETALKTHLGIP